jgi:RNA polymerase sigma-70 factor, ECF subfamily
VSRGGGLDEGEAKLRFEQLYSSAYTKILAYALQRSTTREDAMEVVAETFLVAWRRLEEVVEVDNPLAWLYGVAYRVVLNQHRSSFRQQRRESRLEGLSLPVQDDPS